MSLIDVNARINEIRTQFAMLNPPSGTGFAQALGAAAPAALTDATTVAGSRAADPTATSPSSPHPASSSTGASGSAATRRGEGASQSLPAGTPYASLFLKAQAKYGVDAELLATVAKHESSFNPRAVSHAGAQGLMQLMPATARGLAVADPFDPAQAVDGAARLLRDLTREFGRTDLALAAYNAGPGAVHKYHGIPPYPETQNYVRSIMSDLGDR